MLSFVCSVGMLVLVGLIFCCDGKGTRLPPTRKMAFRMTAVEDVFGGDLFCIVSSHRMSWVVFGLELCQFLRIFIVRYILSWFSVAFQEI